MAISGVDRVVDRRFRPLELARFADRKIRKHFPILRGPNCCARPAGSTSSDGGRIGCTTSQTQAQFGYVAFNNQVDGSGAWTAFKPVPGTIEAVHFLPEGAGQTVDTTPGNSSGGYRTGNVDIRSGPDSDFVVTGIAAGERLGYAVNVSATGLYDVDLRVASASDGGRLVLWNGAQAATGEISIPSTGSANTWRTITISNVPLTAGQRNLGIEFRRGGFDISRLKITKSVAVQPFSSTFDSSAVGWSRFDGAWNAGQRLLPGERNRWLRQSRVEETPAGATMSWKPISNCSRLEETRASSSA